MNKPIYQKRQEKVRRKLLEIFRVLAKDKNLAYFRDNEVNIDTTHNFSLFQLKSNSIHTPVTNISDNVFNQTSPLSDDFVRSQDFELLIDRLVKANAIRMLDHIGFCYLISSQENELISIKNVMKQNKLALYEMTSNDLAKWYFIGDIKYPQDPMIELLPALPNNDPERAYWLPHIHIDVNTNLSAKEILTYLSEIFGTTRRPILYGDKLAIHCVRLWLGTVSGVNIDLDLSTKIRNVPWVRKNLLRKIS